MRFSSAFFIFGCIAAANAGLFVQDGQEYEYETTISNLAGTMDVAPHSAGESFKMKVRVQIAGSAVNVELSNFQKTMYVGRTDPQSDIFGQTKYTPFDNANPVKFSVNLDAGGKFKSLAMSPGLSIFQKNLIKGWAAQLQINSGEIKKGQKGFVSQEQTLHGDCDVTYTVTDDMVYKTVAHMKDCRNRKYRFIDDWRGYRCDSDWNNPQKKDSTDGIFSTATTAYKIGKNGGNHVIQAMVTTGSLIAEVYGSEGASHFAWVNVTSILRAQRSSSGDISASGEMTNSLSYEFADSSYKWNVDRDLKAREPFLTSGTYYEDNQGVLKTNLLKGLDAVKGLLHAHGKDDATIQKNHRHGIDSLYFILYAMDYNTLKSTAVELLNDKSDAGVQKSNLFNELLGNAGTTASALVIRDLIMENKFDNDRDAGRVLTSVAFHIRRPNTQLVKEMEKLLSHKGAERFSKMAIPLAFGHLVQVTCMRAGNGGGPEQRECWGSFASQYVSKFWDQYKSASSREEKSMALSVLMNIRFGGQATKLKDLIDGKMAGESDEHRAHAVWAAGWDAFSVGGVNFFMPVFANKKNPHEVRMAALTMIFYSNPSATDMARILAVLKTEKDYEVYNYAYTLFEQYANTLNPCHKSTSDKARFFLKYMKQFSQYETDWGFGVSKSFVRQYDKKKYGYSGTYHYYTMGSHQSTMPLSVGMGVSNSFMNSYNSYSLGIHLRIEGLAKGLIRKFKTMDPATWKTSDLEKILSSDMNIRARPDQPVRAAITISIKGNIVLHRTYDENDAKPGGKLANFMENMSGLGDTYNINHQRAVQFGSLLYEQPSEIGLPLAYVDSLTWSAHLQATVKRGNHRGLIFRNLEYDINLLSQGHRGMMVQNPGRGVTYAIFQSRIYHIHVPRKVIIGLNPIRREIKLSISRPPRNDPAMFLMHAQTMVVAKGKGVGGAVPELKQHCPNCEQRVIVSRGPGAAKGRIIADHENEKLGFRYHAEYFDCEMDISPGNTRGRALLAFMPYNKNPRTFGASISMGLRQIAAFVALYPRNERCGIMREWSQSSANPVTEIEISIRAQSEENGARMFFRGRKLLIRGIIKAKGQPDTRAYRVSLAIDSTPGNIHNKVKIQVNRAPVAALGIKPYTVCAAYESKYPDFGKEFMSLDFKQKMAVSGKAMLQYGEGTECDQGDGEIRVTFNHETTSEAYTDLQNKWYYQQCMAQKQSSEWSARSGDKLPPTEACYATLYDATNARHYKWKVQFVKLTDRLRGIIDRTRALIEAGMLPYWDADPDDVNGASSTGRFLNVDMTFKNGDKSMDMTMETSQGKNEFKDYPLRLDWTKRLRNLKLTKTIKRLFDAKIISPCVTTTESVRTNDNVTYAYSADSCWTLNSGHCGPKPSYAVFSKKSGNGLDVKAYFGGHVVDISKSGSVKINGSPMNLVDGVEQAHTVNNVEIFKIFKWGSTVNVYSFLRVWIATDGVFVEVMPAPSVRGQHCGLCGNFNRNKFDEWTGKDGTTMLTSSAAMVNEWKWKC